MDDIIPVRRLLNGFTPFVFVAGYGDGYSLCLTLKSALTFKPREPHKDCAHEFSLRRGRINVLLQRDEWRILLLKFIDNEINPWST